MASKTEQALRKIAESFPGIEEGIACKGTAVESATFTVHKKAFLFLSSSVARFKLNASQSEMAKMGAKDPKHYNLGIGGWCKLSFTEDDVLPLDLLEKWVEESYRAYVDVKPKAKKPKKR